MQKVGIIAMLLVVGSVHAETNTRRFTGSPLSGPYLTVEAARNLGPGTYQLGLMGNYESRPAVFADGDQAVEDIIGSRLTLDAVFALGMTEWLDLGFTLPVTLNQAGRHLDDRKTLASYAVGDPRLVARAMLLGDADSTVSLATVLETWLPVGGEENYAGYGGPGATAGLNIGYRITSRAQLAVNLNYELRPEANFAGVPFDDELGFGLGAHVRVGAGELITEGRVATDAAAPFDGGAATAGEVNAAYRFRVLKQHGITLGAGFGLLPRLGTPLWRSFLGYSLLGETRRGTARSPTHHAARGSIGPMTTAIPPGDLDGDGISNEQDTCPQLPEDVDGFRDHDGCPEPDNDLDNVLDTRDQAPTSPEDWDGIGDADGQPELDNDGDGLADAADRCPAQPGAGDGCPGSPLDWQAELKRQAAEAPRTTPLVMGRLILPAKQIQFDPMEEMPSSRSADVLRGLSEYIAQHPKLVRVEVGVHTRTGKGSAHDLWLSQLRAKALVKALTDLGVDPLRLFPKAYGSTARRWDIASDTPRDTNQIELKALLPFETTMSSGPIEAPAKSNGARSSRGAGIMKNIFQPESPIKFRPRKASLKSNGQAGLLELVEFLRSHPKVAMEVSVHTNGLGDQQRMKRLSQERAEVVVSTLVAAGIPKKWLTAVGYGGDQTKASVKTREGRAANKRVEVRWADPAGEKTP